MRFETFIRGSLIGAICGIVAGCTPAPQTQQSSTHLLNHGGTAEGRYETLLNMSVIDYYQTSILASEIGLNCEGFSKNRAADVELNERRNTIGRGSFAAIDQRKDIQSAAANYSAAYKAANGSLCAGAQKDMAAGTSPLSYLLSSG